MSNLKTITETDLMARAIAWEISIAYGQHERGRFANYLIDHLASLVERMNDPASGLTLRDYRYHTATLEAWTLVHDHPPADDATRWKTISDHAYAAIAKIDRRLIEPARITLIERMGREEGLS